MKVLPDAKNTTSNQIPWTGGVPLCSFLFSVPVFNSISDWWWLIRVVGWWLSCFSLIGWKLLVLNNTKRKRAPCALCFYLFFFSLNFSSGLTVVFRKPIQETLNIVFHFLLYFVWVLYFILLLENELMTLFKKEKRCCHFFFKRQTLFSDLDSFLKIKHGNHEKNNLPKVKNKRNKAKVRGVCLFTNVWLPTFLYKKSLFLFFRFQQRSWKIVLFWLVLWFGLCVRFCFFFVDFIHLTTNRTS